MERWRRAATRAVAFRTSSAAASPDLLDSLASPKPPSRHLAALVRVSHDLASRHFLRSRAHLYAPGWAAIVAALSAPEPSVRQVAARAAAKALAGLNATALPRYPTLVAVWRPLLDMAMGDAVERNRRVAIACLGALAPLFQLRIDHALVDVTYAALLVKLAVALNDHHLHLVDPAAAASTLGDAETVVVVRSVAQLAALSDHPYVADRFDLLAFMLLEHFVSTTSPYCKANVLAALNADIPLTPTNKSIIWPAFHPLVRPLVDSDNPLLAAEAVQFLSTWGRVQATGRPPLHTGPRPVPTINVDQSPMPAIDEMAPIGDRSATAMLSGFKKFHNLLPAHSVVPDDYVARMMQLKHKRRQEFKLRQIRNSQLAAFRNLSGSTVALKPVGPTTVPPSTLFAASSTPFPATQAISARLPLRQTSQISLTPLRDRERDPTTDFPVGQPVLLNVVQQVGDDAVSRQVLAVVRSSTSIDPTAVDALPSGQAAPAPDSPPESRTQEFFSDPLAPEAVFHLEVRSRDHDATDRVELVVLDSDPLPLSGWVSPVLLAPPGMATERIRTVARPAHLGAISEADESDDRDVSPPRVTRIARPILLPDDLDRQDRQPVVGRRFRVLQAIDELPSPASTPLPQEGPASTASPAPSSPGQPPLQPPLQTPSRLWLRRGYTEQGLPVFDTGRNVTPVTPISSSEAFARLVLPPEQLPPRTDSSTPAGVPFYSNQLLAESGLLPDHLLVNDAVDPETMSPVPSPSPVGRITPKPSAAGASPSPWDSLRQRFNIQSASHFLSTVRKAQEASLDITLQAHSLSFQSTVIDDVQPLSISFAGLREHKHQVLVTATPKDIFDVKPAVLSLSGSGSETLQVKFRPRYSPNKSALVKGAVDFVDSQGQVRASCALNAFCGPVISLDPDRVDFGWILPGARKELRVAATNAGILAATVTTKIVDSDAFLLEREFLAIQPGETRSIAVVCHPEAEGECAGTLVVLSSGGEVIRVPLSATSGNPLVVTASAEPRPAHVTKVDFAPIPDSRSTSPGSKGDGSPDLATADDVDFGIVSQKEPVAQAIVVTNKSREPMPVGITSSPALSHRSAVVVPPRSRAVVPIRYDRGDLSSAAVRVSSPSLPQQVIAVRGFTGQPVFVLSGQDCFLPACAVGAESTAATRLVNASPYELAVIIEPFGAHDAHDAPSRVDFKASLSTNPDEPTILAPHSQVPLVFSFAPRRGGFVTTALRLRMIKPSVRTFPGGKGVDVRLIGLGIGGAPDLDAARDWIRAPSRKPLPAHLLQPQPQHHHGDAAEEAPSARPRVVFNPPHPAPLHLVATSLGGAATPTTHVGRSMVATNISDEPDDALPLLVAAPFSARLSQASLAPSGGFANVQLDAVVESYEYRPQIAFVTLVSALDRAVTTAPLMVQRDWLDVDPGESLRFSGLKVHEQAQQPIRLTNLSFRRLTWAFSWERSRRGEMFSMLPQSGALDPGASTVVQVGVCPTEQGSFTVVMRLTCNQEPDTFRLRVLVATKLPPVQPTPPRLWFGTQLVGQPAEKVLVLANPAKVASKISCVPTPPFVVPDDRAEAVIPPRGQCKIPVSFETSAPGSHSGSVVIFGDFEPVTVPCAGLAGSFALTVQPSPFLAWERARLWAAHVADFFVVNQGSFPSRLAAIEIDQPGLELSFVGSADVGSVASSEMGRVATVMRMSRIRPWDILRAQLRRAVRLAVQVAEAEAALEIPAAVGPYMTGQMGHQAGHRRRLPLVPFAGAIAAVEEVPVLARDSMHRFRLRCSPAADEGVRIVQIGLTYRAADADPEVDATIDPNDVIQHRLELSTSVKFIKPVVADPMWLSFGRVPVGHRAVASVRLYNTSADMAQQIELTHITAPFSLADPGTTAWTLAPHTGHHVNIVLCPQDAQHGYAGSVGFGQLQVALSGIGASSVCALEPEGTEIDFGVAVPNDNVTRSMLLRGVGLFPAKVEVSVSKRDYFVRDRGNPEWACVLAPGDAVPVEIGYASGRAGYDPGPAQLTVRWKSLPGAGEGEICEITRVLRAKTGTPDLRVDSNVVDFGRSLLRMRSESVVTLTNVGDAPADWAADPSSADIVAQPRAGRVEPGQAQQVKLVFTPSAAQPLHGRVVFVSGATQHRVQAVSTVGIPRLALVSGALDMDLGMASVGRRHVERIALRNTSSVVVGLEVVLAEGEVGVTVGPYRDVMAPGDRQEITLVGVPSDIGHEYHVAFKIRSWPSVSGRDGPGIEVYDGAMRFVGAAAQLEIEGDPHYDFGALLLNVDERQVDDVLALVNNGNLSAEFTIQPTGGDDDDALGVHPDVGVVEPGARIPLTIHAGPGAVLGAQSRLFVVSSRSFEARIRLDARFGLPQLLCDRRDIDFGYVSMRDTYIETVTLTNSGQLPASFEIGWASRPDLESSFVVEPREGVVEPGGTVALVVRFVPSVVVEEYHGIFQVRWSGEPLSVALFGRAGVLSLRVQFLGRRDHDLQGLDFGSLMVGRSAKKTLRLINEGTMPVSCSAQVVGDNKVVALGRDLIAEPIKLKPREQGQLEVTFSSDEAGSFAENIQLIVNRRVRTIPVLCEVAGPSWSMAPRALKFGTVAANGRAVDWVVVSNESPFAIAFEVLVMPEAVRDKITVAPRTISRIHGLDRERFTVQVRPGATGDMSGSVIFVAKEMDMLEPLVLAVTATGIETHLELESYEPARLGWVPLNKSRTVTRRLAHTGRAGTGALAYEVSIEGDNAAGWTSDPVRGELGVGESVDLALTYAASADLVVAGRRTGHEVIASVRNSETGALVGSFALEATAGKPELELATETSGVPTTEHHFGAIRLEDHRNCNVLVRNRGTGVLEFRSWLVPDETGFDIVGRTPGEWYRVMPGEVETLTVSFGPLREGDVNARLMVETNTGMSEFRLAGVGMASAILKAALPDAVVLDEMQPGEDAEFKFAVQADSRDIRPQIEVRITPPREREPGRQLLAPVLSASPAVFELDPQSDGQIVTVRGRLPVPATVEDLSAVRETAEETKRWLELRSDGTVEAKIPLKLVMAVPVLTVEPEKVRFGPTSIGSMASKPLRIHNSSTLPLPVQAQARGSVFRCRPETIVVGGQDSAQILVEFDAQAAGSGFNTDHFEADPVVVVSVAGAEDVVAAVEVPVSGRTMEFGLDTGALQPVDFGPVIIGETQTVHQTLRNISSKGLIYRVELDSGSLFAMSGGETVQEGVVAAGGEVQIPIEFTPGSGQAATGVLRVLAAGEVFPVELRGQGVAPAIMLSDSFVDFGYAGIGLASERQIKVTNLTPCAMRVVVRGVQGDVFAVDPGEIELDPSGDALLRVTFAPSARESSTRTLTLMASGKVVGTLRLIGQGDEVAVSLSTSRLEFGAIAPKKPYTKTIRVANNGSVPVKLVPMDGGSEIRTRLGETVRVRPAEGLSVGSHSTGEVEIELTVERVQPTRLEVALALEQHRSFFWVIEITAVGDQISRAPAIQGILRGETLTRPVDVVEDRESVAVVLRAVDQVRDVGIERVLECVELDDSADRDRLREVLARRPVAGAAGDGLARWYQKRGALHLGSSRGLASGSRPVSAASSTGQSLDSLATRDVRVRFER